MTRTHAGSHSRGARWNYLDWIAFVALLIWSAAGLIFTVEKITPDTIAHWAIPSWLSHFIVLCLKTGDPILILLAFATTHLQAARQWTPAIARRWAVIVLIASFAIETCGALTGLPFGNYHYTDRFGPLIGIVPLTIPLAWHVVVTNALFIVRAIAPYNSQMIEAVVAALICTLYDFVLEPFATTVKHYWVWTEGSIPPLNYVAWFVLSGLLIRIFAPTLGSRFRLDPRPVSVLSVTLVIFLAGRWYHAS